jgi:hypothetical protein
MMEHHLTALPDSAVKTVLRLYVMSVLKVILKNIHGTSAHYLFKQNSKQD